MVLSNSLWNCIGGVANFICAMLAMLRHVELAHFFSAEYRTLVCNNLLLWCACGGQVARRGVRTVRVSVGWTTWIFYHWSMWYFGKGLLSGFRLYLSGHSSWPSFSTEVEICSEQIVVSTLNSPNLQSEIHSLLSFVRKWLFSTRTGCRKMVWCRWTPWIPPPSTPATWKASVSYRGRFVKVSSRACRWSCGRFRAMCIFTECDTSTCQHLKQI